jgi:hypothetical protein
MKIRKDGYCLIKLRSHPKAQKDGYFALHRKVWEDVNNACLLPWTDIDHINKNPLDNRIENLRPMLHGKHRSYHMMGNKQRLGIKHTEEVKRQLKDILSQRREEINKKTCGECGTNDTKINKFGTKIFIKMNGISLCRKCYRKNRRKLGLSY